MKNPIVIINYGMGNLNSVHNILLHLNIPAIISDDRKVIRDATKLILPGVGSFDTAVQNLKSRNLWDSIDDAVGENKTPILGICLGMQLMTKMSEEGQLPGFGWIDADTKKLTQHKLYKVPNIGWRFITPTKHDDFFVPNHDELKFYFVHSYYVECHQKNDVMATIQYGKQFTCAFQKENILGVQFHPEKSHQYGMAFLKYFAEKFQNE